MEKIYQATSNICKITEIPRNGNVQYLYLPGVDLKVNDMIPNLVRIRFTCTENHRIVGNDTITCRDGTWDKSFPECQPFCSPIVSFITFSAECKLDGVTVNCTDPIKPGTIARVACKYGYDSNKTEQQTICGSDGRWQTDLEPCNHICGQWHEAAKISGAIEAQLAQVPWHVSIYKQIDPDLPFVPLCGGTILTARVVISATHCFWDEKNGDLDKSPEYRVKAGKYYREYDDDNEETGVQSLSVTGIERSAYFSWDNGFINDAAIVVVSPHIEFKPYVLPICIDLVHKWNDEDGYLPPGYQGVVRGWSTGKTTAFEERRPSLKVIEYSVKGRENCKKDGPQEMLKYLTMEKFCAERLPPAEGAETTEVDGGSGLIAPIVKDGKKSYFLRGVASTGPSSSTQTTDTFTSTALASGLEKGIFEDARFKIPDGLTITESMPFKAVSKRCPINDIPSNSFATFLGPDISSHLYVGDDVGEFEAVVYICREGYTLKGRRVNVCLDRSWTNEIPECLANSG